jgi:peptidoglycan/xylan/chitin deacetylase (PgdA/CDA1 family)
MRPRIEWPDGKKICATLTVAFEAFTRGGHFKKAKGLEINLVSLSHANYGGNAGIWRILDVLERNKVRATVDVNGLAVEKWPDAVKALHQAGNEIAGHGTTNDIQMTDLTPEKQREEIRAVNRIVKEAIGCQPVGWVSPGGHHTRETLGILADEGYTWCGDQCDDDLPYVVEVDGKRMVIIPKHWFTGSSTTGAPGTAAPATARWRSRPSRTASISCARRRCAARAAASTRWSMPSSAAAPTWRMPSRR